jgi:hypothetical protein
MSHKATELLKGLIVPLWEGSSHVIALQPWLRILALCSIACCISTQSNIIIVIVWESGARPVEEERGRVRRGRDT